MLHTQTYIPFSDGRYLFARVITLTPTINLGSLTTATFDDAIGLDAGVVFNVSDAGAIYPANSENGQRSGETSLRASCMSLLFGYCSIRKHI